MLRVVCLCLTLSVGLVACGDGGDDGAGAPDAAAATDGGETLSFMDMCDVTNDRCDMAANQFCFSFNSKGPHCTKSCSGDGECEAPSPGCNNMGVCKAPDL